MTPEGASLIAGNCLDEAIRQVAYAIVIAMDQETTPPAARDQYEDQAA